MHAETRLTDSHPGFAYIGSQVKQEASASSSMLRGLAVSAHFKQQAGADCIIQTFQAAGALTARLVHDNPECDLVSLMLFMSLGPGLPGERGYGILLSRLGGLLSLHAHTGHHLRFPEEQRVREDTFPRRLQARCRPPGGPSEEGGVRTLPPQGPTWAPDAGRSTDCGILNTWGGLRLIQSEELCVSDSPSGGKQIHTHQIRNRNQF